METCCRYIESTDLATRGMSLTEFNGKKQWLSGPSFLYDEIISNQLSIPPLNSDNEEIKKTSVLQRSVTNHTNICM